MARNKLGKEDYFDFDLIGMVTTAKEYKVAWYINQALHTHLIKMPDISIEFSGNEWIKVSNFKMETDHQKIELVKNKLVASPNKSYQNLLEEVKQFDFFLKYKDETEQISVQDVLILLKKCSIIEYAAILETSLIKSRDNLIF